MPESLPAARTEGERCLFLFGSDGLHDGDQLASDEWEGNEYRRQYHSRHGKDDLDIVVLQPWAPEPLASKQQDKHQSDNHRRNRKRQIDQSNQQCLSSKLELG